MRRAMVVAGLVALVLAGCGESGPAVPTVTGGLAGEVAPMSCDEVPAVEPPAEHLADAPIYVANEQPVEELMAWAQARPGFEELWIDREHLGWVVLGFTEDVEARQAELTEDFPEVGAVVVEVERSLDELLSLQRRVHEELDGVAGSWASVRHGVVGIEVGRLSDETLAAVERAFPDEPVCVSGIDPAELPEPGPQPQAGPGWRLLADQLAGAPYRTGVAADTEGYERLWEEVGLDGAPPAVDLDVEVVIWFGAVYSGSCPDIRLDGVTVTDGDPPLVHAEIVTVDGHGVCTADANPRAYLVAIERAMLPEAPFAIQLGADDPPAGAPEERTLVEANLRQPGAGLSAEQVGPDPSLVESPEYVVGPGDFVEDGYPVKFRFYLHCGPEWLGPLNDVLWRSQTTDTPQAWRDAMDPATEVAVIEVLLETDPPTLTASVNGHDVVYHPTAEEPPGCD